MIPYQPDTTITNRLVGAVGIEYSLYTYIVRDTSQRIPIFCRFALFGAAHVDPQRQSDAGCDMTGFGHQDGASLQHDLQVD